jgi:hypothetical protein
VPRKQRRSTKAKAAAVDVKAPGSGEGPGGAGTPGTGRSPGTLTTRESTGSRLTTGAIPTPTTPAKAFESEDFTEAFLQAVAEHDVKPACVMFGLKSSAVFYWSNTHPDFRERLNAAMAASLEDHAHEVRERNKELLKMSPDDMMKCANAYRIAGEHDIRMIGKLLPKIYGDKPNTQVNIQTNNALVVDEETRQRLIALREKLLSNGSQVIDVTPQQTPNRQD